MSRGITLLLVAALVAGVLARFHGLGRLTLTHPEFYSAPRIELPVWVEDPVQRDTAGEVLREALVRDAHPPGFHLLLLAWTGISGTDVAMLRLPSAICGALLLLALFVYARRTAGTAVALLATWLIALNGHHVFWSQQARPWTLLALLVVVSTWLLTRIEERRRPSEEFAYVVVTAAALWVEYYAWIVVAAQIAWVLLRGAGRERMPRALAAQTLAVALATPVLVYAGWHSRVTSHLEEGLGGGLLFLAQMGGVVQEDVLREAFGSWFTAYGAVAALLGVGALALGCATAAAPRGDPAGEGPRSPVLALIAIGTAVLAFHEILIAREVGHRGLVLAVGTLPWILAATWPLAERIWARVSGPIARFARPWTTDPSLAIGIGTCLLLLALSLLKPLVWRPPLLAVVPFLLVIVARGALALRGARWIAVAAVLLPAGISTWAYRAAGNSSRDYRGLAAAMAPHARDGDALWIEPRWWTAPMHYYLPPSRFNASPPPREIQHVPDRLWLVTLGPEEHVRAWIGGQAERLPDFEPAATALATRGRAVLLVRRR